jgi:hypothetical protein
VSPGPRFKNSAIPSGIVALRLFDFGLAIDVFDVSGIGYSMVSELFISTYELAEEIINGDSHAFM